jgi:hypothetical protein
MDDFLERNDFAHSKRERDKNKEEVADKQKDKEKNVKMERMVLELLDKENVSSEKGM